jgi:aspartate-semialdehyde dehydrogenase
MAKSDTPHIALIGASSLLGKEVKDQLASAGYPSESLTLLDLGELAGVITEYGEEARVLAEAADEEILSQDLVCFCGDRAMVREHMPKILDAAHVALDCTGTWLHDPDAVLSLPAVGCVPSPQPGCAIVLPSSTTQMLATVISALGEAAKGLSATVLVPASAPGEEGLKELAQQCVAVLNLEEIPDAVFGRQRAFDVWPEPGASGDNDAGVAEAEFLRRLGFPAPAIAVLCAPVFHSLSAALHLPGQEVATVLESLAQGDLISGGIAAKDQAQIDSPVRVSGTSGVHIGRAWADGKGGTWLWVLMDNLLARAEAAVSTIQALLPPPPAPSD